jgi:DNA ligase-associated metallophosphoesterase
VTDLTITIAGEALTLLPELALYQPSNQTLFISDVHLGKVETFRAHAIPLPDRTTADDLSRLSRILQRTQAQRIIVLGDLIHARSGQTQRVITEFSQWRAAHTDIEMVLVKGNHDRASGLPPEWHMQTLIPPVVHAPFVWDHFPTPSELGFTLAGHLHPAYRLLGKGRQQLKLPCFWLQANILVLPAFGSFIDSAFITPADDDQVYVIAGSEVLAVS